MLEIEEMYKPVEIIFKSMMNDITLIYEDEPDAEGILRIKGWSCGPWYEVKK